MEKGAISQRDRFGPSYQWLSYDVEAVASFFSGFVDNELKGSN